MRAHQVLRDLASLMSIIAFGVFVISAATIRGDRAREPITPDFTLTQGIGR